MAGDLALRELRARKQVLISQSELYRETLTLEVQNLRLYRAGLRRRFQTLQSLKPLLLLGLGLSGIPLGRSMARRPARSWARLAMRSLLSWRVLHQLWPLLRSLALRGAPQPGRAAANEEEVPAANI